MTQLFPMPRSTEQTDLTKNMRSICIGRLMMDIPEQYYPDPKTNTVNVTSHFDVSIGSSISLETSVSLEAYKQKINTQWEAINGKNRYHDMRIYKQPPQKFSPRTNGYILAYGFREIYNTKWVDGELVKVNIRTSNDAIAYYWDNGTMFTIKPKGFANDEAAQIINNLSYCDWSASPQKPGICLYQGFFEKYYDASYERVAFSIEFTDQWSVSLISGMGAGRDPNYPTLLTREGNNYRAKPIGTADIEKELYGYQVYRADNYDSKYFNGEEVINSSSLGSDDGYSPGWKNEMIARWEVIGDVYMDNLPDVQGGKLYYPDILFQMRVHAKTGFKPKDFGGYPPSSTGSKGIPTQEEFFEVWDAMVDSIQPYPNAFTPKPISPKPEVQPVCNAAQKARDRRILDDFLGSG